MYNLCSKYIKIIIKYVWLQFLSPTDRMTWALPSSFYQALEISSLYSDC